ncbi:uncharacterized protein LOC143282090 [Babylonia areolata]|uniref:uncharacterized protein LOC143282090 n=1 Tax=Babylonia areolata TaxID=304850 RepID=UPI003FD03E1A
MPVSAPKAVVPKPPPRRKDELLAQYRKELEQAERHARNAPTELKQNMDELVQYLKKDMTSDLQLVRCVFIWLSGQNFLQGNQEGSQDENTPEGLLNLVALKKKDLADVFALLCTKVGVQCVCLQGYCKESFSYRREPKPTINSRWTAVHVAGQWGLVHPRLAFSSTRATQPKYRKIESSGKAVHGRSGAQMHFHIDEKFFLRDPDRFIYRCRPEDDAWQLLGAKPWSWEKFIGEPDTRPPTPVPRMPRTPSQIPYIEMLKVPDTEKGYPATSPPKSRKEEALKHIDFSHLDTRASRVPDPQTQYASYNALLSHLFEGLGSDVEKVRALLMWMVAVKEDLCTSSLMKLYIDCTDPATLAGVLKLKSERRLQGKNMFAELCRRAKIPCVLIRGQRKRADLYTLGEETTRRKTWNAVYVDGSWRFISVYDFQRHVTCEEVIEIDIDGRQHKRRDISRSNKINEFFFLTDPEEFIHFALPEDPAWQLLKDPVSTEQFFEEPWIQSAYFQSPAKMDPDVKVCVEAKDGINTLRISGKHSADNPFLYHLYYEETLTETWPEDLNPESYITVMTVSDDPPTRALFFKLPVVGSYFLEWINKDDDTLLKLQIKCTGDPRKNAPFPGNPKSGYGALEAAEQAGVKEPSRKEGMIIAREGDKIGLKFRFPEKKARRQFEARFVDRRNQQLGGEKHAKVVEEEDQLVVKTQVPFGKAPSELALQISMRDENDEVTDVAQYLVTQDNSLMATATQRTPAQQAEAEMTSATEEDDVDRLEVALREGRRHHVEKSSQDKQLKAQQKLLKLHKDACLQAVQEEDVEGLQKALNAADRSTIAYYLHQSQWFQKAEDSLRLLRRKKATATARNRADTKSSAGKSGSGNKSSDK